MAEETILTWNITNWITVVIMVLLGFTILALAAQLFRQGNGLGTNLRPPVSNQMPVNG